MKFRNLMTCLIIFAFCLLNVGSDFEEYRKLEKENMELIRKEDLPSQFSDNAYRTIVEFIRKTKNLDYEWAIFFDYLTGEILRCGRGDGEKVDMNFEDDKFEGCHVASIHNHPKEVLSPPSGKNFGILMRDFENYELIVGFEFFWIFKAKGIHEGLLYPFNMFSDAAYIFSLGYCSNRYNDEEIINRMQDVLYGNELLKYINNKNINDIQLTKKEYVTLDTNSKTATFNCRKRPDSEAIRIAREMENDPNTPSAKEMMYALYQTLGVDVDYDEIFAE